MARTCIILVNWNGFADTIECLESLARLQEPDVRVVVVDNGSAGDPAAILRAWADGEPPEMQGKVWPLMPPTRRRPVTLDIVAPDSMSDPIPDPAPPAGPGLHVSLIPAGRNLGFAAANNLALRLAARDPATEFFWLLNNDTVVSPGALTALLEHARAHPAQGIIGSVLLYYDEPDIVQGIGGFYNARRAQGGHIGAGMAADTVGGIGESAPALAYVMGAAMFVRRSVYERIGGMSEDYFLYYEELDWARRLPPGVEMGSCLGAVIYHKEGRSIGTSSVRRPSDTSLYYWYLSGMRYFWLYERKYLPVATARILLNLYRALRGGDRAALPVTALVFADFLALRRRRGAFGTAEFRKSERWRRAITSDRAKRPGRELP